VDDQHPASRPLAHCFLIIRWFVLAAQPHAE
jgi:hypothetical protein